MGDDEYPQYPVPPSVLAADHYRDPQQYDRELTRVFGDSWLRACPSDHLAQPRDYEVWDRLGQSIVLVRGEDGGVHAWHNVCQHRGARLVSAGGHCGKGIFKCPWHGFAYGLDGKVEAVPLRDTFDPDEIDGLRTPAVHVAEWGGWIWLHLGNDPKPLDDYLGEVGKELNWYGLQDWEIPHRTTQVIRGNWKIVMDAFLETWHVPFTHKDTLARHVRWRDAALHMPRPHSWMTIPVKGLTDRKGDDAVHQAAMICHYLTFPNTIYSCFPTHLQSWTVWPLSINESVVELVHMAGPAPEGMNQESWAKRMEASWNQFLAVLEEDVEVIDDTAAVINSPGYQRNIFSRAEGRLTVFHDEVNQRAAGPDDSRLSS
jgi:choline monooxygenase